VVFRDTILGDGGSISVTGGVMGHLWTDHDEPDLAEVFSDPIIQLRMASAHLSREELTRSIEAVRPALLRARIQAEDDACDHLRRH
jgi:hypothetical protein